MGIQIRRIDWDAVAGILAAVIALILHFLHIVEEGVLLMIALILLALMFLRDLRRESETEQMAESIERIEHGVDENRSALVPAEIELIGPGHLRSESQKFSSQAHGDMVWFNVCLLMFVPQDLFDTLLRPAIENSDVTSIQFVLDERERERWDSEVLPKVNQCFSSDTVREPVWRELDENISFILGGTRDGQSSALLL